MTKLTAIVGRKKAGGEGDRSLCGGQVGPGRPEPVQSAPPPPCRPPWRLALALTPPHQLAYCYAFHAVTISRQEFRRRRKGLGQHYPEPCPLQVGPSPPTLRSVGPTLRWHPEISRAPTTGRPRF
jgi:hypothetical protein